MLMEEAVPLQSHNSAQESSAGSLSNSVSSSSRAAFFTVVEGKNKGERLELAAGTCRALGRSLDDMEKTQVFSRNSSLALDDSSKKVIMQYVSKQFQTSSLNKNMQTSQDTLGGFVRGADFPVKDNSVSRLHAMIFHDVSGGIGILDLVSRNGTFVNGAEIESKTLKEGDLVMLGSTKMRLERVG